MVDLRSDTVTQPSQGMRAAIAAAAVGDDVYGEDPTARVLEARAANLFGKEAALFVPSGTMANQLAIGCHVRPGDEVYASAGSHCVWYESGAGSALWGAHFTEVGRPGDMTPGELAAAIRERAYYAPNPRLVVVENTHNRGGGTVTSLATQSALVDVARTRDLATHLDGARVWNAAAALGVSVREIAQPFDSVSACFSKGLGAPVGSVLAGSVELVTRAHRLRKMLGAGMRQVGVLAAACLYALDHNVDRLPEDHANARRFFEVLAEHGVRANPPTTNIVMIDTEQPAIEIASRLRERGILVSVFGPTRLRAVTHLDVTRADVERAAAEFVRAVTQ